MNHRVNMAQKCLLWPSAVSSLSISTYIVVGISASYISFFCLPYYEKRLNDSNYHLVCSNKFSAQSLHLPKHKSMQSHSLTHTRYCSIFNCDRLVLTTNRFKNTKRFLGYSTTWEMVKFLWHSWESYSEPVGKTQPRVNGGSQLVTIQVSYQQISWLVVAIFTLP